ncbi:AP-5 complex subunit zeta-1 isoform X1 [Echinops telfairi]|uniref:AP-5 complex subunit zeta-1 isoform X1 n=1 Tax=Echinops telfairi TaxID=9371 RepID=A0AC55CRL6_ECHTE|nr:AP-5 complex subunit zeta-1 isoform X1 [Echinops telfairi]
MSSTGMERLLRQAREIQDGELSKFCARITKLLQQQDSGAEAVDALQRLLLILSATKYRRKLEQPCMNLLQTTLCSTTAPPQLQLLCAAILREMAPVEGLALTCEQAHNSHTLSLVASVLLAQGDRQNEVGSVGRHALQLLEARPPEGPGPRLLLPVLSKVVSLSPGILPEGSWFPPGSGEGLLWQLAQDRSHLPRCGTLVHLSWLCNGGTVPGPADTQYPLLSSPDVQPKTCPSCPRSPGGPAAPEASGLAALCQHPAGVSAAPWERLLCSSDKPGLVTEVDGSVATDFFTVLSTSQRFTEDQRLNVLVFSMLRTWLLLGLPAGLTAVEADDRSELEGSTQSVLSAASATASRLLPPQQQLRAGAFEYCQRILEQSGRRALRRADSDLQKACLVEAVLLLDLLCRQEPSFLYPTLPCLKALLGRLGGDPKQARTLLPVARFLLSHGEAAAVDSEAVCRHLFTSVPAELFPCPMLAFELVQFCRDSLHILGPGLGLLKPSFPNLLKLLAWHSPALTSEFVVLLPSLVDAGTAVELLHALLDLPCLTAALDLQLRLSPMTSEWPLWDISLRPTSCLEGFRDPHFQPLFQFLLRSKAAGSTLRLAPLYRLLQPLAGCARVFQCAQAVPTLLHAFFSAVPHVADAALMSQLALALLERSGSLFPVPQYEDRVHRVLSTQLLGLCRLRPALVVELARDLLGFAGSVSGIRSQEPMFTAVVWAAGEYLTVAHDRRCTVEQVTRFFEALEALLFEVTQSRRSASPPQCQPQVITVLMTTLTKLASRSQDLIPRVSLLLSKLRTLPVGPGDEDTDAVRTRATELTNLLKMPSVAQFVFSPGPEANSSRFHRDATTALPLALRTVSQLVDRETSLLPA